MGWRGNVVRKRENEYSHGISAGKLKVKGLLERLRCKNTKIYLRETGRDGVN
jgi:hypothetical protein